MPTPKVETVAAYLDAQPEPARRILRRVHRIVKKACPALAEAISYGMPTYLREGRPVVFLAAWKAHWSLYPATAKVLAAVPELLPFKHAKDTVRFDYADRLPTHLVARMVETRLAEVAAKPAKPAKLQRTSRTRASRELAQAPRARRPGGATVSRTGRG